MLKRSWVAEKVAKIGFEAMIGRERKCGERVEK